jgi:hypothetical protein
MATAQNRLDTNSVLDNRTKNMYLNGSEEMSPLHEEDDDPTRPIIARQEISRLLREWPRVQPH